MKARSDRRATSTWQARPLWRAAERDDDSSRHSLRVPHIRYRRMHRTRSRERRWGRSRLLRIVPALGLQKITRKRCDSTGKGVKSWPEETGPDLPELRSCHQKGARPTRTAGPAPSPSRTHQQVSVDIETALRNRLKGTECGVFAAPFDALYPRSTRRGTAEPAKGAPCRAFRLPRES